MKKLSAYTIAANCTDLMDCCDGYIEVREAQKNRIRSGKAPFKYFDTRRRALWAKLISFVRTQNTYLKKK